jgi:type IV pilus assembly protein PilX
VIVGPPSSVQASRGMALLVCLVLLLALTVTGLQAARTSALEARLARNQHDALLAFEAAESALRDGERFVEMLDGVDGFDVAGPLWLPADAGELERWEIPGAWSAAASFTAAALPGVSEPPRFLLELLVLRDHRDGHFAVFRVTARGTGGSDRARSMLQTTYRRFLGPGPDDGTGYHSAENAASPRIGRLSWHELPG